MSQPRSVARIILQTLLGTLVAANLALSIVLLVSTTRKSRVGYVDMHKVVEALLLDIERKNQDVLALKGRELSDKKEVYEKMKKDFERKKARGKSSDNAKTNTKLMQLEEEIEAGEKALNEDYVKRMNDDLNARIKDVMEAIAHSRKKRGCHIVVHEPVLFCLDPRIPNTMRTTISCDDKLDISHDVLDKLGLKEASVTAK